jgi:hypothetical protein
MSRFILYCFCGWVFSSCSSSESKTNDDSISGVYVREYSSEILNQLSGNKVGMRTIRDTIFIEPAEDGFRIKNVKWRMNDYDEEGWQDMRHGESGPLPSFNPTFDEGSKTLNSKSAGFVPPLNLKEQGKLSFGEKSAIAYTKVQ